MASSPFRLSRILSSSPIRGLGAVALLGAALLGTGCHPKVTDPNDPKFVVAEKGDWKITEGELEKQVSDYMQQTHLTPEKVGPEKMPMLKTAMLDNMVLKKLLLDKGAAMNLKSDDLAKEDAAQLERLKGPQTDAQLNDQLKAAGMTLDELKSRIHEKTIITKVLQAEVGASATPSEQEINDIYMKYKDRFVTPEKVRVSRILFHLDDKASPADKAAKKKAADKAEARLKKGEDFSKVAMDSSEDQSSKDKGGDIGFLQKGESEAPEFDAVIFNSKEGVVSPVFETSLGYQIVKVTAIQPAGTVPLAEVRAYISQSLGAHKMEQAQEAYNKKLLADSQVNFHLVRAEFPAQPPAPAPQDAGQQSQPMAEPSAPDQAQAAPDAPAASAPSEPATK